MKGNQRNNILYLSYNFYLIFQLARREGADVEPAEEGGPLEDPEVEGAPDAAGAGQQRTRWQTQAARNGQGWFEVVIKLQNLNLNQNQITKSKCTS